MQVFHGILLLNHSIDCVTLMFYELLFYFITLVFSKEIFFYPSGLFLAIIPDDFEGRLLFLEVVKCFSPKDDIFKNHEVKEDKQINMLMNKNK